MSAYDKTYLRGVVYNLAALFDIAVNAECFEPNQFGCDFAQSRVAFGIEHKEPDYLAGKSAVELLSIMLKRDVEYNSVPNNRTPEYWAGWVLALAQWHLNKPFKDILEAVPLGELIALYYPYHEADEMKTIEYIQSRIKGT